MIVLKINRYILCLILFYIVILSYTPSCEKVVIEGKNISSLVRKEYD